MRVTSRDERRLTEIVPGVRRGIYFDAAEGAHTLSLGVVEIDPGAQIPWHRHGVEEGFHVLEGSGVVSVADEERPIRTGSFCVMTAGAYHSIRNTGTSTLRIVMAFSGTEVKMERRP